MLRVLRLIRHLPSRLAIAAAPLLRFLAALFLLAAVVLFVAGMTTQHGGHISTAAQWQAISPSSLATLQAGVTRQIGGWAWDPVLTSILALPAYVLLGVLALISGFAGRRRPVVNVYVN